MQGSFASLPPCPWSGSSDGSHTLRSACRWLDGRCSSWLRVRDRAGAHSPLRREQQEVEGHKEWRVQPDPARPTHRVLVETTNRTAVTGTAVLHVVICPLPAKGIKHICFLVALKCFHLCQGAGVFVGPVVLVGPKGLCPCHREVAAEEAVRCVCGQRLLPFLLPFLLPPPPAPGALGPALPHGRPCTLYMAYTEAESPGGPTEGMLA